MTKEVRTMIDELPVAHARPPARWSRPPMEPITQSICGINISLQGVFENVLLEGFQHTNQPPGIEIKTHYRDPSEENKPSWKINQVWNLNRKPGQAEVGVGAGNPESDRRFLIAAAAYGCDMLPLHASSVLGNKGALIFRAPSGTGKTTISTKLLKEQTLVHDDLLVVDTHTDTKPMLCGSRLLDPLRRPATPDRIPIAGIFVLKQGEQCEVNQLSPAQAVSRLLPGLPLGSNIPCDDQFIDKVVGVVAQITCFELTFTLDASEVRKTLQPWLGG